MATVPLPLLLPPFIAQFKAPIMHTSPIPNDINTAFTPLENFTLSSFPNKSEDNSMKTMVKIGCIDQLSIIDRSKRSVLQRYYVGI